MVQTCSCVFWSIRQCCPFGQSSLHVGISLGYIPGCVEDNANVASVRLKIRLSDCILTAIIRRFGVVVFWWFWWFFGGPFFPSVFPEFFTSIFESMESTNLALYKHMLLGALVSALIMGQLREMRDGRAAI